MTGSVNTNLIDEDEIIEIAYDYFLEGAMDNLEPADQLILLLQFEECGAAETVPLSLSWQSINTIGLVLDNCSEVIIGLAKTADDEINDIFARILISRDPAQPFHHILWKK